MSEAIGFVERARCDLCGSEAKGTLLSKAFSDSLLADFLSRYYGERLDGSILGDASFTIVKCRSCGFIWQQFVLNDVGMRALYDRWISPEESLNKRRGNVSPSYARQADAVGKFFAGRLPADIRVLDFGMGWGYWCVAAKAAGYSVAGLDVSEARVRHGREMGIEVIENLAGQRFDFINAEQVFEHIPAPRETVQQLAEHLNPDGVIHIAVPNGAGVERQLAQPDWKPASDAVLPLEHINCFTRRTLIRLGEAAGLRVVPPPLVLARKYGWQSAVRGVAVRCYRQFSGTGIYFRKVAT